MKNIAIIAALMFIVSCSDQKEILVPFYDEITFNEVSLDRFSHKVIDGGFENKGVKFNTKGSDRNFAGFAYSNRSNRSFVWTNTPVAQDSNRFSVYTPKPNRTEVYLVGCAKDDQCYFTLTSPKTVEHILFGNTTENYLGLYYGPDSGTTPIANPNVPSAPKGIWKTHIEGLTRKANQAGDYLKITVTGFNAGTTTGSVDVYLRSLGAIPTYKDVLRSDWVAIKLSQLGPVDKVLFTFDCSLKIDGKSLFPPYFCIDGIRLK